MRISFDSTLVAVITTRLGAVLDLESFILDPKGPNSCLEANSNHCIIARDQFKFIDTARPNDLLHTVPSKLDSGEGELSDFSNDGDIYRAGKKDSLETLNGGNVSVDSSSMENFS